MTDEQKFAFDLKGYLLMPGVLTADEIKAIKVQIEALRTCPETLAPHERVFPGGAASMLIDHPVVMDVLDAIIGPEVRMESSWFAYRTKGQGEPSPHGGGVNVNPNFSYRVHNGKIYSALTRIVFELNDVVEGEGGTLLLAGSHKSNFPVPPMGADSPLFETYGCPAGSMLVFTENLCHSTATWQNPDKPRIAVFNCYNHVGCQFHHPSIDPVVLAGLTPARKAFFRDVWVWNQGGPDNGKNVRFIEKS